VLRSLINSDLVVTKFALHGSTVAIRKAAPVRCFVFAVESSAAPCEGTLGYAHTFYLTAFSGGVSESRDYWVRVIAGEVIQASHGRTYPVVG